MAGKYYAVRKGRKTGIFRIWEECKASVSGYPGAEYKSFPVLEQAEEYLGGSVQEAEKKEGYVPVYVDGSYNSATKEFSYGMVVLLEEEILTFHQKYEDEEPVSYTHLTLPTT